jgi:hypothetical protein
VSGRPRLEAQDLQNRQEPDPLQDRGGYLHLLLDESPMHREQDRAPSAAPPRRALRRSGLKSYRGTFAYEKALRKRRVWVEPLFGEAKDWHGV